MHSLGNGTNPGSNHSLGWVTLAILSAVALLSACSTAGDFSRVLDEPVKATTKAAGIAEATEKDVLKATSIGMTDGSLVDFSELVCVPWAGPFASQQSLDLFGDALDTVKKVSEKPSDTTYAGYLRKFRESSENSATARDFAKEQEDAKAKALKRQQRCQALYKADLSAKPPLKTLPTGAAAVPAFFGTVLALDQLVKLVLAQVEMIQREAAVRATINSLIPQMDAAQKDLAAKPTAAFGPLVVFPPNTVNEAVEMNGSAFGATITIRRWFVAQNINAQWIQLKPCRDQKGANCLGDSSVQKSMNDFADNVAVYRSLANIDSTKILTSLNTAVNGAKDSLASAKSPASWIDALVAISDSVSSLSDAYSKYEKSKE